MEITYTGKLTSKYVERAYYQFHIRLTDSELQKIKRWLYQIGIKDYSIWEGSERYPYNPINNLCFIWFYNFDDAALFQLTFK